MSVCKWSDLSIICLFVIIAQRRFQMINTTYNDLLIAYKEVDSIIKKCEKIQNKFIVGSAQYTLLKNRINSMYISRLLIENELVNYNNHQNLVCKTVQMKNVYEVFSKLEIENSLSPVLSIIRKCEKAQSKYEETNLQFKRYVNMIHSMLICKLLIEKQINELKMSKYN